MCNKKVHAVTFTILLIALSVKQKYLEIRGVTKMVQQAALHSQSITDKQYIVKGNGHM